MRNLFKKVAIIMLFMLTTTVYSEDIHITVYGKGGIVIKPDGTKILCPNTSTAVCNEITMPDDASNSSNSGTGISAVMLYEGHVYNVVVVEFYNLEPVKGGLRSNGVRVKFIDDEHIN